MGSRFWGQARTSVGVHAAKNSINSRVQTHFAHDPPFSFSRKRKVVRVLDTDQQAFTDFTLHATTFESLILSIGLQTCTDSSGHSEGGDANARLAFVSLSKLDVANP
ncbi:hypothetical protein Poly41_32000 [Novipirellula artificiosorum]|uniref:Uncharacterized protein n=1 Tax=Novipirellula artificiosorum TaxID=2528016 RepID=A0A5C6DLR3_9BACT|nr:hypothetical protein Poly41_32000 [Novipirellula artificiosorum]